MDFEEVKRVLASLEAEKVDYAVFGALAMNLHGLVRATEDVDLFIRADRENLERLKRALDAVYHDPNIADIDVDELLDDYPSVRYYPEGSELYFDILTRLGELYSWESLETQVVDLAGTSVRVITPRMLVRMKAHSVRPKDQLDAAWIREEFGIEE